MKSRTPATAAHEAGLAHAARRAGEDRLDRQPPRRLGRHHAAAGGHGEHAVRVARRAQLLLEAGQVAVHQGLQVRVEHRRREALEFAVLGHDVGRARHGHARAPTLGGIRDASARAPGSDRRGAGRRRSPRRRRPSAASSARSTLAMSSGTSTEPSAASRSATSKRCLRSTTGLGRTKVGTKSAGILRLVRPISMRSRKPAVVRTATRAPRRSSTALVPTVVPCTRRRTSRAAMPRAVEPREHRAPPRGAAARGPW